MDSRHTISVLHLSDLHFGRHHRFEGDDGLGSLLDRLRQDLDERRDREGLRPDLIVLSGDFAEHGDKDELARAHRFAQGLSRLVELPPRRVVMVPGNHDINWHKCRAYFEDCFGDGAQPEMPYFRKLVFYKQFFDRFYEGEAGIAFTEDEPWSFFEFPELGVVVAGLNSVMAESHRPEDHHGFLGERQLRAFAEKLRPYKEQGYLRIGVLHHAPRQRRGPRAEEDFKQLKHLLRPSLNLVLHGDVHEEHLDWLHSNVPVFGVGSAAVGVEERAPEVPNEYQILQIHRGGVRRGLRAYVPDQKRWVGSPRADAAGEQWVQEIPVAFDRVEALGEASGAAPAVDLVRVMESYRQAIARNQGTPTVFDLLGVNEAGESAGGLDFLRVFVPQDALRAELPRPEREDLYQRGLISLPPEPPPALERPAFEERFFERAQPVDELLGGSSPQRFFLLGAPGAGKTALTRWLLLKLCAPGEGVPGLSESLIPVRVEMRGFDEAHRRASGTYTFFDHLDREHGERFLSLRGESLRALAREGRLYWLFDGLDEVIDEDRRHRYAEMIAGLIDEHPGCRSLVTSRLAGAEIARPLLERARFLTYTLQDFTEEQRDRFLDAWHELVFARDPEAGRHRRARIASALSSTSAIGELCKNPLLCSLLAYLNREEELPQRRHRLYQKILERMAEHWEANKGLPLLPAAERFDLESKLLFLRRLAWQMMEDGRRGAGNAIEQGALEDFAARFCEQHWGHATDAARRTAEALLRQLRERNYVLAFFGGTTYGFAHRTFLEYLAAVEAHEHFRERRWELADLEKLFAARWQDPAWEEVLLLLCGFLQDAKPDHVVRVLQGIPSKDRAIVYGSLEEYLAFCIKALGELSRLDGGVPYDFARGINDILAFKISQDWTGILSHLQPAFRRCAGRWPQVDRLVAVTKQASAADRSWKGYLFTCWIAAAGKEQRLPVLLDAIKNMRGMSYAACTEAADLGPWSAHEIMALCDIAETRTDDHEKCRILISVVRRHGVRWKEDDLPIQRLHGLLRSSASEHIREPSAWILLRAGCHREEAHRLLKDRLSAENKYSASNAALHLSDAGYGDEVIGALEKFAPENPGCMVELARMSKKEAAHRSLNAAVMRLREHTEPSMFLHVVTYAESQGFLLVSHEEIADRLHALDEVGSKVGSLGSMQYVPTLCPLAVREYKSMYKSMASSVDFPGILSQIHAIQPQYGGAAIIDLWIELMASDEPNIAIQTAGHILRTLQAPSIRERARQRLLGFLGDEHPEGVRLLAARNLDVEDAAGREVHVLLARTAQHESTRFTAARFAGDIESLNALAEKAVEPHWREMARRELETYGQINSLLHVGRPRRARVRLHGREAGVLEETAAGEGTRFTYAPDYLAAPDARPLAPNLPLRAEPYESDTVHPFFANLLPEGPLYDQTARRLGLRRTDRFGMLLQVGGDVMGAVEVLPEAAA